VGGISNDTDEALLLAHFGQFGEIEEVPVMRERGSRAPRGFAFVVFKEEVAAAAAAAALEAAPHVIDGRTVDVKKALQRDEQGRLLHPADANGGEKSESLEGSTPDDDAALLVEASAAEKARARHKIFIGGLASTCDEAALRAYFSAFGEIKDSVVMYDPLSKRSRGFGFIAFSTEEAVDSVFKLGPRQEICGKIAEIKRAVPKEPGSPVQAQNGRRSSGRRSRGRARGRGSGTADASLAAPEGGVHTLPWGAQYPPEGAPLPAFGVPVPLSPQALAGGMYPAAVPPMFTPDGMPMVPMGYAPAASFGQWHVPHFAPNAMLPEMQAGMAPVGQIGMVPAGGPMAPVPHPLVVPLPAMVDGSPLPGSPVMGIIRAPAAPPAGPPKKEGFEEGAEPVTAPAVGDAEEKPTGRKEAEKTEN
jgi:RNA recognition motif-containing protein